jgi:hypothetical protein
MPMAEAAARQALSIDPKIGEAHAVLAQLNAERGDLLDAESGFFFAISLEPNEPTPHHWYSLLLSRVGRMEEATAQARRAQELDPTSAILAGNLAAMYLMTGLDEQALRYSTLAKDLGLGRQQATVEARVALRREQWDAAARLVAADDDMQPELRAYIPRYVQALADPAKRPAFVAEMRAIDPAVVKQVNLMQPYIELGALDVVYPLLFESLAADPLAWLRDWDFSFAWTPEGAAFRRDPRFAELAERIGMVDYWKQYGFPDGCRAGDDTPIVCS